MCKTEKRVRYDVPGTRYVCTCAYHVENMEVVYLVDIYIYTHDEIYFEVSIYGIRTDSDYARLFIIIYRFIYQRRAAIRDTRTLSHHLFFNSGIQQLGRASSFDYDVRSRC